MTKTTTAILAFCFGCFSINTVAQNNASTEKRVFKLKYQPSLVDNYSYKVFYLSDGKVFNVMNFALAEKLRNAQQFAVHPGGATCAVLVKQGGSSVAKAFNKVKNKGKAALGGTVAPEADESKVQTWIDVYDANAINMLH